MVKKLWNKRNKESPTFRKSQQLIRENKEFLERIYLDALLSGVEDPAVVISWNKKKVADLAISLNCDFLEKDSWFFIVVPILLILDGVKRRFLSFEESKVEEEFLETVFPPPERFLVIVGFSELSFNVFYVSKP